MNPDLPPDALQKPLRGAQAAARKARQRAHKDRERAIMKAVRAEDGHCCRVPHCRSGTAEVAHRTHRGMGGNPQEDRTVPEGLITLCVRHHDMFDGIGGELTILPLSEKGFRGPCEFHIDGFYYGREQTFQVSETRGE